MAGREGLIDTAVKTANSGYLQRCLIKNMEVCMRLILFSRVLASNMMILLGMQMGLLFNSGLFCASFFFFVFTKFRYGEDSIDVVKSRWLKEFHFQASNLGSVSTKYQLGQVFFFSWASVSDSLG